MRQIASTLIALLVATTTFAQAEIMFRVLPSTQDNLSEDANRNLTTKIKTALTRCNAAAAGSFDVFVVEPTLTITGQEQSQGLMQTVNLCQGELTLIAKNAVDGSEYHSATIRTQAASTGSSETALLDMIKNIKPTDTSFSKFVRQAREKIEEHYARNCAAKVTYAQTLYDAGQYKLCVLYLNAISPVMPCYEQADELRKLALEKLNQDPIVIEKEVIIEKEVEKPVIIEKEVVREVVVEKPVPTPFNYNLTVSNNRFTIKIVSVKGVEINQRIEIEYLYTNNVKDRSSEWRYCNQCIDSQGNDLTEYFTLEGSAHFNCPYGIETKGVMHVKYVDEHIPSLKYVSFRLGDTKVELRDAPVDWTQQ